MKRTQLTIIQNTHIQHTLTLLTSSFLIAFISYRKAFGPCGYDFHDEREPKATRDQHLLTHSRNHLRLNVVYDI
jgi:hypothetical protein